MAGFSEEKVFGMTVRESANDGSDFTNPDADYRRLFLGEDGALHLKDSSGTVTDIGGSVSDILDLPTTENDTSLVLAPDGAGGVEFRAEAGGGGGGSTEPPAEPDAADDEGTGADTDPISGWTTLGTLAVLDRDTTVPGHIYMSMASTGGTSVRGIYKAKALSNGEAFVAKLTGALWRANYNRAGIFIGVATPGRIDTIDLLVNGDATHLQAEVLAMTDPTTLSSQVAANGAGVARPAPVYLAIRRNSSTSYDYLWSHDGWFWFKSVSARDPSMTQATIGLFINDGAGGGTTMAAAFDWARIYSALPGIAA
jgi:hypothetical protein